MTQSEALRETAAQYRELLVITRETPAAADADDLTGLFELLDRRDRVFGRIRELGPRLAAGSGPSGEAAELAGLIRETLAADRLSQAAVSRRLGFVRHGLGEVQRGRDTGRAYRRANAAPRPTARFIDEVR